MSSSNSSKLLTESKCDLIISSCNFFSLKTFFAEDLSRQKLASNTLLLFFSSKE